MLSLQLQDICIFGGFFTDPAHLSPTLVATRRLTKAAKNLMKMRACQHCNRKNVNRWCTGPDGLGTLCQTCNRLYVKHCLPIFKLKDKLSIKERPGWEKLRVIGFRYRKPGLRNQLRPVTVPISVRDKYLRGYTKPVVAKRTKLDILEGCNAHLQKRGSLGCQLFAQDKGAHGEASPRVENELSNGELPNMFTKECRLYERDAGQCPMTPSVHRLGRRTMERPFMSRLQALKESGLILEQTEDHPTLCSLHELNVLKQQQRGKEADSHLHWNEVEDAMTEKTDMEGRIHVMKGRTQEENWFLGAHEQKSPEQESDSNENLLHCQKGISVKATLHARGNTVMRRFSIQRDLRYARLKQTVLNIFGAREQLILRYRDNWGDFITVSSDVEVAELYRVIERANIDPLIIELL